MTYLATLESIVVHTIALAARATARITRYRLAKRDCSLSSLGLPTIRVYLARANIRCEQADIAMRICGVAAFRKKAGIELLLRNANAATIMAPTSDWLFGLMDAAPCDAEAEQHAAS